MILRIFVVQSVLLGPIASMECDGRVLRVVTVIAEDLSWTVLVLDLVHLATTVQRVVSAADSFLVRMLAYSALLAVGYHTPWEWGTTLSASIAVSL